MTKRRQNVSLSVEPLEQRLVMSLPDLVPTLVDADGLGAQEEIIQVETEVQNRGQQESGPYTVQYRMSLDDTIDAGDRLLMTQERPSIIAGGTDHWDQPIKIPDNLPQGRFFVGAIVDTRQIIAESDETNNIQVDANRINVLKGLPLRECSTLGAVGTGYEVGVNCRTVTVDGYPRTFVVYVPDGVLDAPNNPVPMVAMFHGGSGNGGQFLHISGWREKADAEGLIAVFPTGAMYCKVGTPCENGALSGWTTKWNGGALAADEELNFEQRPPGYPQAPAPWPADDVQFVGHILDDVQSSLPVDPARTYASGFSNGAGFTRWLSLLMSDRFAAVAYVGGGVGLPDSTPEPEDLIPAYTVVGAKDDGFLERAGMTPDEELPLDPMSILTIPGFEEAMSRQLDIMQLAYDPDDLRPDVVIQEPHSTLLSWETPVAGNESGNSYHFAIWGGLTHHYPNGNRPDKNPHGFVAVDTFWEFFQQVAKQTTPNSQPGDANHDGDFNQLDIVQVLQSGLFGTGEPADWEQGDWNKDGTFDRFDLVRALQTGAYL